MRPLWDDYAAAFGVTSITRVAVRYINRLQVKDGDDIDSCITIAPRVPESVSKHIVGYFAQMVLPIIDLGPEYRVVVNSGVEPNAGGGTSALLLDIDVFREGRVPSDGSTVWRVLETLRAHKNKVFEGAITDKVREMIR